MKQCSKCLKEKCTDEFYAGKKPGTLRAFCKSCISEIGSKHYVANKERISARGAAWRVRNKEKISQHRKIYREKNKEKIKAYFSNLYKENREEILARNASWAEKNPEKRAKISSSWAKNNPDRVNAKCAARRALKLLATPKWADKSEIEAIYKKAQELTIETGIRHEVDHIFPLKGDTVQGLHVQYNLQILPMSENRRKWKKLPNQMEHRCL
jgi:5-methylcytosine-specific restriction endonuclease McrA